MIFEPARQTDMANECAAVAQYGSRGILRWVFLPNLIPMDLNTIYR